MDYYRYDRPGKNWGDYSYTDHDYDALAADPTVDVRVMPELPALVRPVAVGKLLVIAAGDRAALAQSLARTSCIGKRDVSGLAIHGECVPVTDGQMRTWLADVVRAGYAVLIDVYQARAGRGKVMITRFPQVVAAMAARGKNWAVAAAPDGMIESAQRRLGLGAATLMPPVDATPTDAGDARLLSTSPWTTDLYAFKIPTDVLATAPATVQRAPSVSEVLGPAPVLSPTTIVSSGTKSYLPAPVKTAAPSFSIVPRYTGGSVPVIPIPAPSPDMGGKITGTAPPTYAKSPLQTITNVVDWSVAKTPGLVNEFQNMQPMPLPEEKGDVQRITSSPYLDMTGRSILDSGRKFGPITTQQREGESSPDEYMVTGEEDTVGGAPSSNTKYYIIGGLAIAAGVGFYLYKRKH